MPLAQGQGLEPGIDTFHFGIQAHVFSAFPF